MIYGDEKKVDRVDFLSLLVVVYTHSQHTFMFKQHVKEKLA